MNLDDIHRVYFIGIGGIGMSALARYFHALGKEVAGYDRVATTLTKEMESQGISVHYDDDVYLIPPAFYKTDHTLIIRTPAVPESHSELQHFLHNQFTVLKRSEVLGNIVNEKKGIAISGTHGKTTVSSMTAFLLNASQTGCSAFLGGISKNFNSNLLIDPKSEFVVTEADEFDRSFHRLYPYISLVTAVDADHLDIYKNYGEVVKSFEKFLSQTNDSGVVIKKKELNLNMTSKAGILTYSLEDESADYHAQNIKLEDGKYTFDISTPEGSIGGLKLNHIGITNVENAVAAVAIATQAGVTADEIKKNLPLFSGIKRRFDIQYEGKGKIYIDDYAHHPKEISALLHSVRSLYPAKKISGIFQPHLFSRTRDFAGEFAESLNALDELILLDIYPARELPIKGVTSELILKNSSVKNKKICSKVDCVDLLKIEEIDVLLTIGAGDIDELTEPIKKKFLNEEKA
jgi:UDP-N-acetylmuramate--alanine ligase